MGRNYDAITFISKKIISKYFLRRPSVAIFTDIIKNITMFIKAILKDLKTLKEIEMK